MSRSRKANGSLTAERLRELVTYDPDTGLFRWRRSIHSRVRAGKTAGYDNGDGYIRIGIDGAIYRAHRLAWLYMMGSWPPNDIDHKNLVKSDNRWANLRHATDSLNGANRALGRRNTSGFKGVSFEIQSGKWLAAICVNRRRVHLGLFATREDAAKAYKLAAKRHFGEYARSS